ncbi:hypothetical protein G6702_01740 [Polynucleobacter paneuropaeus]|nr:hypothetical protein G6702_01740 [Polynucleobacter paneuropaeus]
MRVKKVLKNLASRCKIFIKYCQILSSGYRIYSIEKVFNYSNIKIDVVIPCIEKDINCLKYTIESIRKNILHPIGNIYIISPVSNIIESFCKNNLCIYIEEDTVLPLKKKEIIYKVDGEDRSGWLFQQLLKLGADLITKEDHYLVVDADTIFLKSHKFIEKGNYILRFSDEFHIPYYKTYEKLFLKKIVSPVSFITHNMLFSKIKLRKMKSTIEKIHSKSWFQAIIQNIDHSENSSFSEYELYGNFLANCYSEKIIMQHWNNLSRSSDILNYHNDLESITSRYSKRFSTISLHSYNS